MKSFIYIMSALILTFCLFGCGKERNPVHDASSSANRESSSHQATSQSNSAFISSVASMRSELSSTAKKEISSSKFISSSPTSSVASNSAGNDLSSYTPSTSETASKPVEIVHTYYKKSDNIKIFIIGNSFIGSSQIGNTLQEMFSINKVSATAENVSIGYYTATRFSEDLQNGGGYFDSIKNGEYNLLFLSGFYSYQDVMSVENILNLLPKKTKLVLLPAQNEGNYASSIRDEFPTQHIVNWKDAIDSLYIKGFSKFELAFDDTYLHTNVLGGYVGASMIYSYLYNEIPNPTTLQEYVSLPSAKKDAINQTTVEKSKQ